MGTDMFKVITTALATSLLSTAASAAVVDAFELNVRSAVGTNSTAVLAVGKAYDLTVSGTFFLGTNRTRHLADAEFFNLGAVPSNPLDMAGSREIGVGVNGVDLNFGAFNPLSVYTARIYGGGNTINVFFADSAYGDNSGSLRITICEVPLPASSLLLLAGLGGLAAARRRAA